MINKINMIASLSVFVVVMALGTTQIASAEVMEYIFPLDGIDGYPTDEMIANCGGYYDEARARIYLREREGKTRMWITVKNAVPNTLFTVWLKLVKNPDYPNGSPLTGAKVTAAVDPVDIPLLASATPDDQLTETAMDLGLVGDNGYGAPDLPNAFYTDARGNGNIRLALDYPITKGAYPFQSFDESLSPLAFDNAAFTVRVASHCEDQLAHGLIPGRHEMFFDWRWSNN